MPIATNKVNYNKKQAIMKKLTYLLFFLALGLTACVDDDSRGITTPLPELSIAGSDSETMPVYNVYYGDEFTLDPGVEATSENLTYTWSYGTYTEVTAGSFQKGDLTTVSNEPVLRFSFPAEGMYYVHLNVTDGQVGAVMEYRVNVTNYYDKGILVVANSADGRGNLGFIKELTPEDIAAGATWQLEEHTLEAVNPDLGEVGTLVGADRTNAASTPFEQNGILIVAFDDHCLYVNPTTFEVNARSNYDEVFTGFRATHFLSADSYASFPFVYDKNMGESIHIQEAYWFLYSHSTDIFHYKYDDVITGYTWQSSINSKTLDPVYIDYSIPEIYMNNSMFGRFGTEDLLEGQNLLMVARETTSSNLHIVAQSRENPLELTQYTLSQQYNLPDYDYVYFRNDGETTYTASTSDGIPAVGTHMTLSQESQVAFYPIGGGLYAYYLLNPSPTLPTTPLIAYPAGEEITCLNVNVATNELYVGTYTEATGRGNVYIYAVESLDQGDVQPKREFPQSTDRIADIRYKN